MLFPLLYLGQHCSALERGLSQGKVREIQVEYVKEDIGKDEDRGDDVNRPPEKETTVGSKIMKHLLK